MISRMISPALLNRSSKDDPDVIRYYQDAFQRGEVRVFYEFNDNCISYHAYFHDDYAEVSLFIDDQVSVEGGPFADALLEEIVRIDSSEDEEFLKRLYGKDYTALSLYARLGPKKAKTLLEASKKVDDLASRIEYFNRAENSRVPGLRFVIEPGRSRYLVSLRLGFNKLYLNRKVGSFLRDYYQGMPIRIQKEYVTIKKHGFPEKIEKALQFLYNSFASDYYYAGSYPVELRLEELLQFLLLLDGEEVDYNGFTRKVLPVKKVELCLDAAGNLESNLPVNKKGMSVAGQCAVAIDDDSIQIYEFVSEASAELYNFYRGLKGIDGELFADLIARKVLPVMKEGEVTISPEFEQKHPILRPVIEYYVGLEQNGSLTFKTVLRIGHDEVGVEEFKDFSNETSNRYADFTAKLVSFGLLSNGTLNGEDAVVNFLSCDLASLKEYATVYVSEELQARHIVSMPNLSLMTSSGQDWFEVKLYSSGYTEEELLQLYGAFTRKKKYVRLKDNYILLDQENEEYRKLSEAFSPDSIGVELPLYQALKVPFLGAETDDNVRALIERVTNYNAMELGKLPKSIERAMRPYQKSGIQFLLNLYSLRLSGILSDDMGLGKTLQSFGLFSQIQEDKPILVISPKSLIYNWMEERNKWYPSLPAHILVGTPKERKAIYAKMPTSGKAVYFVSYDTLRNDLKDVQDVEFSCVLLDEGQYIANAAAQKSRAVKEIKADARFCLTGTPVQNSLMDLWSIFDFLLPGYFPPLTRFKERYGGLEFSSEEARKRLLVHIKPFLLGRKKKDVLSELPDKENITLSLPMGDEQLKVYESYLAQAREMMAGDNVSKLTLLSMMTRLRQICISPSLFLEGDFGSSKIDALADLLLELKKSGRKALVFSSFVSALEMVRVKCKELGLNPESITGETSAKVRVILAERFNKPDSNIDVMLVSLKAGGTGLNLVGADTVFHLDPWWNLAAERQAEDRAHRIGQKNKVTVFKLVTKNTIEEKVLALQEKKGLLIDLTDEASLEGFLTDEDYKFLLS